MSATDTTQPSEGKHGSLAEAIKASPYSRDVKTSGSTKAHFLGKAAARVFGKR